MRFQRVAEHHCISIPKSFCKSIPWDDCFRAFQHDFEDAEFFVAQFFDSVFTLCYAFFDV